VIFANVVLGVGAKSCILSAFESFFVVVLLLVTGLMAKTFCILRKAYRGALLMAKL